jgi:alkylhydroperoxidase/carboxymuconolactone decarboxylase family protein YurZ
LEGGVPHHTRQAKKYGATREELISAILVGLPAAGYYVTLVLHDALSVYDEAPISEK